MSCINKLDVLFLKETLVLAKVNHVIRISHLLNVTPWENLKMFFFVLKRVKCAEII